MSSALAARSGAALSFVPQSFAEAIEFAKHLAFSGMVPDVYTGQPGKVLAAMQLGAEVGLPPMTALQRIFSQNGKPTMDTRGCLAVVQASGHLEEKSEEWDAATMVATVRVKRKGHAAIVRTFSQADAAKVVCVDQKVTTTLDKKGTYQAYPQRMYTRRALGYALMDEFADILCGLTPWDVMIEMSPNSGEQPTNIIEGELVRQPPAAAPSMGGMISTETAVSLDKGFEACGYTSGMRAIKLAAFRGREPELVEQLRKEFTEKEKTKAEKAAAKAEAEAKAAAATPAAEKVTPTIAEILVCDAAVVMAASGLDPAALAAAAEADVIANADRPVHTWIDEPLTPAEREREAREEEPIRMIDGALVDTRSGDILAQPASKLRALAEGPRRRKAEPSLPLDGGVA